MEKNWGQIGMSIHIYTRQAPEHLVDLDEMLLSKGTTFNAFALSAQTGHVHMITMDETHRSLYAWRVPRGVSRRVASWLDGMPCVTHVFLHRILAMNEDWIATRVQPNRTWRVDATPNSGVLPREDFLHCDRLSQLLWSTDEKL